jgi:geranylgeranyl diphosphate synthase type II
VNLNAYLKERREQIDRALEERLPPPDGPAGTINRAMRYAVMGGGKRLRPILVLAGCEACGGEIREVLGPAAALEMIHTYSLIHDDLPAMDDDDLRRGRATVHKAFGEAEAVLAGDGLLTLAFEILATEPPGESAAPRRTESIRVVARAAGVDGMIGGQVADLEAERVPIGDEGLRWIHRHKTGALIRASLEIGAVHACGSPEDRAAVVRYGEALGLAFQIADDVLDVTATMKALGKTPGKDARAGKATYPSLHGLDASRREAARQVDEALAALRDLPRPAPVLEGLARFAIDRSS